MLISSDKNIFIINYIKLLSNIYQNIINSYKNNTSMVLTNNNNKIKESFSLYNLSTIR